MVQSAELCPFSKHNLQESIDSLTKNIATKKFSYFKKNKIHILIRTTKNREEMLAKTLKSIEYQNYQNIKIFISYDHIDCLPYLQNIQQNSYLKDKLKYFKVEKTSDNQCLAFVPAACPSPRGTSPSCGVDTDVGFGLGATFPI